MCNSPMHMDLEVFACMHGTDKQYNTVLANCEIAQLQQTTEILQQSYITQILYKLLAPDVWYIW